MQPLPGLNASDFDPYQERAFESWVKVEGDRITIQGRLRMSDNLDEAKVFFVDVAGRESLRLEVVFKDFHHFNLAYHCGTAITLTGDYEDRSGQPVITKVTALKSVHGNSKPGTQKG